MPRNYISQSFYSVADYPSFAEGVNKLLGSLHLKVGTYTGDNLITWGKNLSFVEDEEFLAAASKQELIPVERSALWRIATVAWGAMNGMRLEGDLVECACYRGTTARIVADYIRLADQPERKYFLYDMFDQPVEDTKMRLEYHGADLYDFVRDRFSDLPNVVVTKGRVPDSLSQAAPEKIAFMHLDLNNAEAEMGALEMLFERMVPGAVLILDDYGWIGYRAQKLAEDPWLRARGYRVLELPTGQGMVIR